MGKIKETFEKAADYFFIKPFDDKLKRIIRETAWSMSYFGSCVKTIIKVCNKLNFSTKPFDKKSNVDKTIQNLIQLSENEIRIKIIQSPDEAQELANENFGNYLIIAAVADYIEVENLHKGGVHHMAYIIRNDNYKGIPACGGGGLNQEMLEKGWDLSNARIHFNWGLKKIVYKNKTYPLKDPKECMKYFYYALK